MHTTKYTNIYKVGTRLIARKMLFAMIKSFFPNRLRNVPLALRGTLTPNEA